MAHGHVVTSHKAAIADHLKKIGDLANSLPVLDENASQKDLAAANVAHSNLHHAIQDLAAHVVNTGVELREHEEAARKKEADEFTERLKKSGVRPHFVS